MQLDQNPTIASYFKQLFMKTLLQKNFIAKGNRALLKSLMIFGLLVVSMTGHAQLFQQDFTSSTTVANYANATTPSNGQFNAISTSGAGVTYTINTTTSNKLRITRGSANAGAISRTTDFSPTPASMLCRFDLTVSGNSAATTSAVVFGVGSGFTTNNSSDANASHHSRWGINIGATAGQFSIRDISNSTTSATFSGTQAVLWAINNSGASLTYKAPDGTYETIANDRQDLWLGNTRVLNDVTVETASQTLTDFKIVMNGGTASIDFDNILIDPIPAAVTSGAATSITPTGFTANWTPVSGVTGYRLDVATDAGFTSLVSGYNNLYVSGQATASQAVTGLSSTTQYWYRVRAASQYTVGEFAGANSSSQTATTTTASGIDGVISANEYGTHTNGNNQQSSATGTWYMNWDNTNLYIGVAGTTTTEGAVLYLDKNPIVPVNGGSNSDGNLTGNAYDGSNFANLQFRSDLVVYFKDGYNEYRTADGSGGWSSATTGSAYASASGTREIAIPWSSIGGKPSAFNWFGYVAYTGGGAYASVPTENPGSGAGTVIGSSARWDRYYTVSDTTIPTGTKPFARNSYTFTSASDVNAFGLISAYDFTMNSSGLYISRTGGTTGDWTIGGNLVVGNGAIYMGNSAAAHGVNISGNLNLLGGTYSIDQSNTPTAVTGNVTIASGATLSLSGTIGGDLSIGGNFSNSGTFTNNGRLVTFGGAAPQSITGATTFGYLTLNNALGLTLNNAVTVSNDLALTSGKITLGANNLTVSGSITSSATNYIVTNGTGQLRRPVAASATLFPVGISAYNPITFNNSGTSDTYGVNVLDGTYATPFDNTKIVNRRWQVSEAVAGGSNLSVVGQYNTGETAANFAAGTNPKIGFYNGTAWTDVAATAAGSNPFTYTSNANLSPSDLTAGTQYFGLGKDNAFVSVATQLAITTITPASPTQDSAFSVTVVARDSNGLAANVVANTVFSLTTNGNAGTIGGTVTGTILAGTNSIVVSGVTLNNFGTGVTVTATRTAGDVLSAATSSTFTVLAKATHLTLVSVPSAGNVGLPLSTFTVEARRGDNTVDTNYTGSIVITKASGPGTIGGTTSVSATAGVASFSNITFDTAGTVTLTASSTGLTPETSGNIAITLAPVALYREDFGSSATVNLPYTYGTNATGSGLLNSHFSTPSWTQTLASQNFAGSSGGAMSATVPTSVTMTSTFNVAAGYKLIPTSIAYNYRITSTGPTTLNISIADAVGNTSVSAITTTRTNVFVGVATANFLSSTTEMLGPITLTFTFTGASGGNVRLDDVTLNGNVICVQPDPYTVTGGGNYCSGGSGVAVGLSGSQRGVSYQLKINGTNSGSPVAGTGSVLSFGNQTTVGTYTVEATNINGSCNYTLGMTGSVNVALNTSTTWTGGTSTAWTTASNWSCGVPLSTSDVTIGSGTFQPQVTSNVSINTLNINSGSTLKVVATHNLTITGSINNNGSLEIENNANLIQTTDTSNIGSGTNIVRRNSASIMRQDYTLWSSPVVGQELQAFSPMTLSNRFYIYDPAQDIYVAESATHSFSEGVGYLIRVANNHPITPTVWNGTFTGTELHNGTVNLSVGSGTYNAVGNPYPSTIDADTFMDDNGITAPLYFWRKTNNPDQTNNPTSSYATYTKAGGAGTDPNPDDPLALEPNGVIQVGQGFIAQAATSQLSFNNLQRIADNGGQFFRTTTVERHRIWLDLINSTTNINQMMVAYMEGATSGIDASIDGRFFKDTETALNSVIAGEEFAIQGRALPFVATDVVPLVFKTQIPGTYSIRLNHVDGLFLDGQSIYIRDNLTSTIHNIRESIYTFATEAGTFNNRFEIVYDNQLAVSQPSFTESGVVVYKQEQNIVVNTGTTKMSKVEVYDIRGRLLVEKTGINAAEVKLNAGTANQVLILKITSEKNETVTKKVVN
jgi:hypothetical protein